MTPEERDTLDDMSDEEIQALEKMNVRERHAFYVKVFEERLEQIRLKQIEDSIRNEDVDFLNFRESLLKILVKNSGLSEEEFKMLYPRFR